MSSSKRSLIRAAVAALLTAATGVRAHGDAKHGPAERQQMDWGIASDGKLVARTVTIRMLDTMRFSPHKVAVKQGEAIRFVIHNEGKMLHEFVIGTKIENDRHAALMLKFPDMAHSEPYMAHVPPGKQGEIFWTFNRAGQFHFACLIAGHYQGGMVGTITVTA
jgi:uncharacterized cupredoxin-like copper-binding protein